MWGGAVPEDAGKKAKPLESLLGFIQRLSDDRSGGVLGDALSGAIAGLGFLAGFAYEVSDGRLTAVTMTGVPRDENEQWVGALRSVAERAVLKRGPIYVRDVRHANLTQTQYEALRRLGWNTLIAAPIADRRAVLGVLLVAGRRQVSEGGAVRYLDAFARLAAQGMLRQRSAERDRAQREELLETARLAELGLMTACVAHELRGPVTALNLLVTEQLKIFESLRRGELAASRELTEELISILEDSQVAVTRLGETLAQMSTLTRKDVERGDVDLGQLTEETLPIVRANLQRRGVRLVTQLEPDCVTRGRKDGLAQVLVNLVLNAADACEEAGDRRREVTVATNVAADHVTLTVSDTGPGVPSQRVHSIFEPFFTTKEAGRGTGLGLKICSDVISQHKGHIEVENQATGGAVFRVVLPKVDESRASGTRPRSLEPEAIVVNTRYRVLIVDDDVVLARTLKRSLRSHDVMTVHSARETLEVIGSFDPDVILCDMFLPDGSGAELHAQVAARHATLGARFLFLTGGGLSAKEATYLRASGCPTLIKPISIESLQTHMDRLASKDHPPSGLPTLSLIPRR